MNAELFIQSMHGHFLLFNSFSFNVYEKNSFNFFSWGIESADWEVINSFVKIWDIKETQCSVRNQSIAFQNQKR